jgi:hypothetical protein
VRVKEWDFHEPAKYWRPVPEATLSESPPR